MSNIAKGLVVQYWYDDGLVGGWLYGEVVASGPKAFTVLWESGLRNRRPQGDHLVLPVPPRLIADATQAIARSKRGGRR